MNGDDRQPIGIDPFLTADLPREKQRAYDASRASLVLLLGSP